MKQNGPPKNPSAQGVRHDATPAGALDKLERILRAQLEGHQRLLKCMDRKRQAIRTADIGSVADICAEENIIIQRLAEVEKHRLELLGRFTEALRPKAAKPLTMAEIAQSAAEPQQTRLITLAAQLRETLGELKAASSIIRAAAETLSRHMTGIVQTVQSALSRACVYGSRGKITTGAQLQSLVDVKS